MQTQFILTPFFLDQPRQELEALAKADWMIEKLELQSGDTQARMSVLHESMADRIADIIREGKLPVSIAGDCCATIGVLAGLQRVGVDPQLIWFDAHGDFNTWDTTPSGFLGGMPLAMLAGLGDQSMPKAVGLRSLSRERIILTDGRDLDPGEKELVEGSGIQHFPDPIDMLGHPLPDHPLYVHFDTDIINPIDAPAMSYAADGGPRIPELEAIFRSFAQTGRIAAISLSTWNPKLDVDGQSKETCMKLLQALLPE